MAELHLFVLWPAALRAADRIYADLERRFELVDSVLLHWPPERFEENLMRLYGTTLPKRGQKVDEAGDLPFHVLVVRDTEPVYAPRPRSFGRGPANAATYDAKLRYRAWAGGAGYAVHATIDRRGAERDLLLLLGRSPDDYADAPALPWERTPRRESHDEVLGADGWGSWTQLFDALRACLRFVVLQRHESDEEAILTLLVDDRDRAATLAAGAASLRRDRPVECRVAGRLVRIHLRELGDGTLDPAWQRALLHHPVRHGDGALVPPPSDAPYIGLYEAVVHTPPDGPAATALAAAPEPGLPPGDYRDPAFARAVLDEFLFLSGYDYVTPPQGLWRNPLLFSRPERFRRGARRRAPRTARIVGAALLRLTRNRA